MAITKISQLLLCILLSIYLGKVVPIKCIVGYGQRGLKNSNEITWTRDCRNTDYCWEAVTTNMDVMSNLVEYPFVSEIWFAIMIRV